MVAVRYIYIHMCICINVQAYIMSCTYTTVCVYMYTRMRNCVCELTLWSPLSSYKSCRRFPCLEPLGSHGPGQESQLQSSAEGCREDRFSGKAR